MIVAILLNLLDNKLPSNLAAEFNFDFLLAISDRKDSLLTNCCTRKPGKCTRLRDKCCHIQRSDASDCKRTGVNAHPKTRGQRQSEFLSLSPLTSASVYESVPHALQ